MAEDIALKTPKRMKLLSASHRRAPRQEAKVAKMTLGAVTPGSGNGTMKGDVRSVKKRLRVECKATIHDSFSLKREMIEKIEAAACGAGEQPALCIEFVDKHSNVLNRVVVLPDYVFDMISDQFENVTWPKAS